MEDIKLTILGKGSAMPTRQTNQSSQILEIDERSLMIDCGEGTQITLRQMGMSTEKMCHIYISHEHGDHCLGLPGLLSSLAMQNRRRGITLHCHPELKEYMVNSLKFFGGDKFPYTIEYDTFSPYESRVLYEDKRIKVTTFPLYHSLPSSGFLVEEKPQQRHLRANARIDYGIPIYKINDIKDGADFETAEGKIIRNELLTLPPDPCRKYAYCCDTRYNEKIIPYIEGADCLYHEATFMEDAKDRAKVTQHSTARQAATIALKAGVKQLIIGHFSARYQNYDPLLKEAKEVFPNTLLAEERKTFRF